jgi:hypothetical protein
LQIIKPLSTNSEDISMSRKHVVFFAGLVLVMLALLTYSSPADAGVSASADAGVSAGAASHTSLLSPIAQDGGDLTCTVCHNDTTLITGKETAWSESVHGTGTAYVRGTSADCAGCHSGGAFSAMVAAGLTPNQVEAGDPNPTRQDCRTCHNIHTTYTADDWSLETTDPVTLIAFDGVTYDGGKGNLCANCHQPRTAFAADENGMVNVSSTHWGPHHGPQSAMLLGVGGAGDTAGSASPHSMAVADTCVTCHLYEGNHSFDPNVAVCQQCHSDATDFDVEGVQTQVEGLLSDLSDALIAKGMLSEEDAPVVGEYPEAEAAALWNYIYVSHEDKSKGVHNPGYTIALLQASIDALK